MVLIFWSHAECEGVRFILAGKWTRGGWLTGEGSKEGGGSSRGGGIRGSDGDNRIGGKREQLFFWEDVQKLWNH